VNKLILELAIPTIAARTEMTPGGAPASLALALAFIS
jgi:hypothetical protein